MKNWLNQQRWLTALAARRAARRNVAGSFILDDWAPFSYVVGFANRGKPRRRNRSSAGAA